MMYESQANDHPRRRWGRLAAVAVAAAVSLVVGGALLLPLGQASAGFFGRHHGEHGPEAMREKTGFVVEWILSRVDASEEQQARVDEILDRTFVELAPLQAGREADRAAFVGALTGPTVDRTTLEELRTEKLAQVTVISEEILTSLADIAAVLTPEQRQDLAAMAERWHRWHD